MKYLKFLNKKCIALTEIQENIIDAALDCMPESILSQLKTHGVTISVGNDAQMMEWFGISGFNGTHIAGKYQAGIVMINSESFTFSEVSFFGVDTIIHECIHAFASKLVKYNDIEKTPLGSRFTDIYSTEKANITFEYSDAHLKRDPQEFFAGSISHFLYYRNNANKINQLFGRTPKLLLFIKELTLANLPTMLQDIRDEKLKGVLKVEIGVKTGGGDNCLKVTYKNGDYFEYDLGGTAGGGSGDSIVDQNNTINFSTPWSNIPAGKITYSFVDEASKNKKWLLVSYKLTGEPTDVTQDRILLQTWTNDNETRGKQITERRFFDYNGSRSWSEWVKVNGGGLTQEQETNVNKIPAIESQLETKTKYNEHKLPARTYLEKGGAIKTISCFGDSITAGDFNEPNFYARYPMVLSKLIYENGFNRDNIFIDYDNPILQTSETTSKILSDTTFSNDEFVLTKATSNAPRFYSDVLNLNENYYLELEIDSTLTTVGSTFNFRFGYIVDGVLTSIDESITISEKSNKKYSLNISKDFFKKYGNVTGLRIGLRLNSSTNGDILKVKNIKFYKSNIVSHDLGKETFSRSGVTIEDWLFKFQATPQEKTPRTLSLIIPLSPYMKTKKYILRATISPLTINDFDKLECRMWLTQGGVSKVDKYGSFRYELNGKIIIEQLVEIDKEILNNPNLDGFAYGFRLTSFDGTSSLIIDKLELIEVFNFYNVLNNGISGDTTQGGVNRLQSILDIKPNFCFIAFGTNDIRNGVSLDAYLNNIKTMIDSLRTINCIPIIATLTPLATDQNNYNKVIEWNEQIKYFSAKNGCRVWDRYWHFEDGDLKYIVDGRHPGTDGYKILGETSFKILNGELSN